MTNSPNFLSPHKARLCLGVCSKTLRNWDKRGLIKTVRTPTRIRLYDVSSVSPKLKQSEHVAPKRDVIYARVSSAKQKPDLERQVESLRSQFPHHQVIRDVGSGINWKRPGLKTLLRYCMDKSIRTVVVAHRDRLSRLGFELFEFLVNEAGGRILVQGSGVQGEPNNNSGDQFEPGSDLGEDLLSIIHVFSCRHYGKRKYGDTRGTRGTGGGGGGRRTTAKKKEKEEIRDRTGEGGPDQEPEDKDKPDGGAGIHPEEVHRDP